MQYRTLKIAALLPMGILGALAWTHTNQPLHVLSVSKLWVAGTSNVKDFTCTAKSFDAVVDAALPNTVSAVLNGQKGVGTVELTVPVEQLDCNNNSTMTEHMRNAIKAKDFKEIVFRLSSYDIAKVARGSQATLNGALTIAGVTKDITFTTDAYAAADSTALVASGKYQLHLKDFNLKAPSLMLGTMRVGDVVTVNFELYLKP
jgi:hypothetical protein